MERVINKIVRLLRKRYFIVVFLFTFFISILGITYSYWSQESGWQRASEISFKTLAYNISVNSNNTSQITVPASSGTTFYNVEISSLNDINTRYLLTYISSVSGITIETSSISPNFSSGIIGIYESEDPDENVRIVRIAVTNNTAAAATITLTAAGGYTWNPAEEVIISQGYSAVSGIYNEVSLGAITMTLTEEVGTLLDCVPTASSPCLFKENSENTLYYSGHTWRIMGTYLINGESVTKLVLNEPLTSFSTYSNVEAELSTFYNSLDKSLIRTNSPFICSGTDSLTCTGSANIGLISKSEYDSIGGVNSYLYTKPQKDFWMNTESFSGFYYTGTSRGASSLAGTFKAYVRPSIYIKSNTLKRNPAKQIIQSYLLTINPAGGTWSGTSPVVLEIGKTLTLATPVWYGWRFMGWQVSGQDSTIVGSTFTMGSANATLTAIWEQVNYQYTVNYSCNGASGSTAASTHAAFVTKALNTNTCNLKMIGGTSGMIYYFAGWSTSSTATTATYSNGQSVVNLVPEGVPSVTLFAVWRPIFSYTGSYQVFVDSATVPNWRVKFLTSGTYTSLVSQSVDVFLVGGGGAGGSGYSAKGGGGGGGGRTTTVRNVSLSTTTYSVVIGAGGVASAGGASTGFGGSAAGGNIGGSASSASPGIGPGGAGGSGGGGGGHNGSPPHAGNGGSYGSAGSANGRGNAAGGAGQGTTTCEFGEGTLTACTNGNDYAYGGGGGGRGGVYVSNNNQQGNDGSYGVGCYAVNRGCGGLGNSGTGTTGIVIIRNKR